MMLKIGDQFPSFSLPNQNGDLVESSALKGKRYVIYFYPKDDTSGCTTEACEFTGFTKDFGDTLIYGVSPDGVKSHKKFADKREIGFDLLADEEKTLISACGLWVEKSMYGKKYMGVERTTFLVDEAGVVKEVWAKVKPAGHAADVLKSVSQG
ncbi:MAG: peroxiredoxin [Fimbriimonadaceae bacterium]